MRSYFKNDHVGFTIPYMTERPAAQLRPGFRGTRRDGRRRAEFDSGSDGRKAARQGSQAATARTLWVPAVNNHGGFGRWAFLEMRDPWNRENRTTRVPEDLTGDRKKAMAQESGKQAKTAQTDVESIRHKDKRTNIPTEELRDFVADEEKSPEDHALPARPVPRPAIGVER